LADIENTRHNGYARPSGNLLGEEVSVATKKPATGNTGFNKALTPSKELAAVIGADAVLRTKVTKRVWDYIKKHNLQDAANKRNINADD
jgi:chromatin remodeling complex protein RSC6